ncbi:MAG: radical SAM protein [Candidatus Helarchaeota archaeon]|nr:radical SAM protein [Candidatus Helarchaeota archaeon]
MRVIRETISICPECKQQIDARVVEENDTIYMRKICPRHGDFEDILAKNARYYLWRRGYHHISKEIVKDPEVAFNSGPYSSQGGEFGLKGCPYDCGICENHKSATCICLIDITNRCNLKCPICFANANVTGFVVEPTMKELREIMEHFRATEPMPPVALQLSGGEPTVRDDLPEILEISKELGFKHRMLTTNGLKFTDIDYLKEIIDAGMNVTYMQWDSVTDPEVYKQTRGKDLLEKKMKIVENMRELGYKDLALVPTIARGVNDHQVGHILDFAVQNQDVVSCIIYQPISLCGRITKEEIRQLRYNASDLFADIDKHTNNLFNGRFYPIPTLSHFVKLLGWFEGVEPFEMTSHEDCGFATIGTVEIVDPKDRTKNKLHSIDEFIDIDRLVKTADRVWDFLKKTNLENKPEVFSKLFGITPTGSKIGSLLDGISHTLLRKGLKYGILANTLRYLKLGDLNNLTNLSNLRNFANTIRKLATLIRDPGWKAAANFLRDQAMLVSCMHFQDAYNIDTERVSRCLVHYGYYDRELKRVFRVPFCTMNTIHRDRIERKNAQYQDQKIPVKVITPQ